MGGSRLVSIQPFSIFKTRTVMQKSETSQLILSFDYSTLKLLLKQNTHFEGKSPYPMQQTYSNSRDCDCHKYEEMPAVSYDKISAGCGWSLFTVICESLERCVPGNIPHQTENSAPVTLLQIHLLHTSDTTGCEDSNVGERQ